MKNRFFIVCFILFVCTAAFASLVCGSDETKVSERPASSSWIKIKDGRITADIKEMELAEVLKEIFRKAKINFTIDEGIKDKISIKFAGATIEEALKRLCENRAIVFEYQPEKQAYRIVGVGAYSGQKEKKSEKIKFDRYKHRQKQKTSGQLFSLERKKPGTGSMKESTERIYDSKGRLLYKPGELLVKFKEGITEKQIADLHKSLGSTVLRRIDRLRLEKIKLREGFREQEAIEAYFASGFVEIAERHALRYPQTTPNDPYFEDQWGLVRIRAPEAWDFTQGSPEIIIAVIDTGVDYYHPDFADNMWTNVGEIPGDGLDNDGNGYIDDIYGWDFAGNDKNKSDDADSDPMDVDGHGTHVAGIVAAKGNNNIGIAGVCWNAKIMALKVQADNGEDMDDMDIIEAISYAINNGAQIVNCSFGGEGPPVESECAAFVDLKNNHILAVCAAGNDGVNTDEACSENYPSCYDLDNIIAVAASDQNDNLASISNYGLTSVDVMAPGEGIKSTVPAAFYMEASVTIGAEIYTAYGMAFAGTTDAEGITALLYDCEKGYPNEFPAEVSGNIALIERGSIYFSEKVSNAQEKGAVAVIIYNNDGALGNWTLGAPGDWLPVVCISREDGLALKGMSTPQTTVINTLANISSCFENKSGTSMAAPHVSGIAGLILSKNPALDYSAVKLAILSSVDKLQSVSGKMVSEGRLNALNALCSVNTLPGDFSFNGMVGLDDAIIAIQIISGLHPTICSVCISAQIDVNGDGRIGLEEAIYILQKVAGLRF